MILGVSVMGGVSTMILPDSMVRGYGRCTLHRFSAICSCTLIISAATAASTYFLSQRMRMIRPRPPIGGLNISYIRISSVGSCDLTLCVSHWTNRFLLLMPNTNGR